MFAVVGVAADDDPTRPDGGHASGVEPADRYSFGDLVSGAPRASAGLGQRRPPPQLDPGALQWRVGAAAPGQLDRFPLSTEAEGGAWISGWREAVDLVIA